MRIILYTGKGVSAKQRSPRMLSNKKTTRAKLTGDQLVIKCEGVHRT